MPAKGKSKVTPHQRKKIAAHKAAGKTNKAIAKTVRLAEKTVEKQLKHPETLNYALAFKQKSEKQLERMWATMMRRLATDLDARDSDIRRHARTGFLRLLVLGEGGTDSSGTGSEREGDCTLEELLIVYRKDLVAAGQHPSPTKKPH